MKLQIPEFPNYYIENNEVYCYKNNKLMRSYNLDNKRKDAYKLKHFSGKWRYKAKSSLLASVGIKLNLPETAKPIPHLSNYYIDIDGSIYSYSILYPMGIKLIPRINSKGYPVVSIQYKNLSRTIEVHKLMALTFIVENYTEKGLCCLHLDNDKTNNCLSNLAVGTYSQNNKQAYKDGLNPGNGLKKLKNQQI